MGDFILLAPPRPVNWRCWLLLLALCLAGALLSLPSPSSLPEAQRLHAVAGAPEGKFTHFCGETEEGVDYDCPALTFPVAPTTPTQGSCCALCQQHAECAAWTWVTAETVIAKRSSRCVLKRADGDCLKNRVSSPHAVSGLQLQRLVPPSLFCFEVLQPTDVDLSLVEMQRKFRSSVFACDDRALYSNASVEVALGVWTTAVESDMAEPHSIQSYMVVWRDVVKRGVFLKHDWTVKVNPSAVFLPNRLLPVLAPYAEDSRRRVLYFNNCDRGLRGGLEVFSRSAVEAWGMGASECFNNETRGWREDRFIDRCLSEVLQIERKDAFHMLVDAGCHPAYGLLLCRDARFAAFHPFHDLGAYTQCLLATQT